MLRSDRVWSIDARRARASLAARSSAGARADNSSAPTAGSTPSLLRLSDSARRLREYASRAVRMSTANDTFDWARSVAAWSCAIVAVRSPLVSWQSHASPGDCGVVTERDQIGRRRTRSVAVSAS